MAADPMDGSGGLYARVMSLSQQLDTEKARVQRLSLAISHAVSRGPPTEHDPAEGSIGWYVCCGQPESGHHATDCWWDGLRKVLES